MLQSTNYGNNLFEVQTLQKKLQVRYKDEM